eukprot:449043-Prorocentrum_lima.AAC.1
MGTLRLQGGWQVGVETGASNGSVPLGLQVTCRPCHTLGRRRLLGPPGGEANRQAAKGTVQGLGES